MRNPEPARGLSSSLQVGIGELDDAVEGALIVLGDQPRLPARAVRALLDAGVTDERPIVVPVYDGDLGRNPVLVGRAAFALVAEATGDRGLGPLIEAHPELVREIPIRVEGGNPDVDTRADLVGLLEAGWSARVVANAEQVDRVREVPDGSDFYAPVTGLFRADPTRTDEPVAGRAAARWSSRARRWLDIGAGAGRYALPLALALAPSGGRVIARGRRRRACSTRCSSCRASTASTERPGGRTRWPPRRDVADASRPTSR